MQQSGVNLETSPQSKTPDASAPGNTNPSNNADAGKPPAKATSLMDLFKVSDDGVISENDDSNSNDPNAPIDSLDRAIKKLGMTAEDAYKIKIPMRDGQEPVTLGALKDRIGEVVDLEQRELQFDQHRRDREGEILRAENEVRELMQLIPRENLKPELIQKVRAQHDSTMRRERQLTVEHIPEWRDDSKRLVDIQGMTELVQSYGFPESFITTVVDHRALKMLRDFYRMDQRIRKALANVTTPPSKGFKPSGKNGKGGAIRPDNNPNPSKRNVGAPTQRSKIDALFKTSE